MSKCKGITRKKKQCLLQALDGEEYCRFHIDSNNFYQIKRHNRRLSQKEYDQRDAKLAMLISTGVGLLQIAEKVTQYFNESPEPLEEMRKLYKELKQAGAMEGEAELIINDWAIELLTDAEFENVVSKFEKYVNAHPITFPSPPDL